MLQGCPEHLELWIDSNKDLLETERKNFTKQNYVNWEDSTTMASRYLHNWVKYFPLLIRVQDKDSNSIFIKVTAWILSP